MKLTEAEIDRLSTPEERSACFRYKALQRKAIETGYMGETDLLVASQAIGILAERNKRLGLINEEKNAVDSAKEQADRPDGQ